MIPSDHSDWGEVLKKGMLNSALPSEGKPGNQARLKSGPCCFDRRGKQKILTTPAKLILLTCPINQLDFEQY
jgi:hypothetical protein